MLTISRLTKRVRQRLFSCFVKQDIAFFETTSKGQSCMSTQVKARTIISCLFSNWQTAQKSVILELHCNKHIYIDVQLTIPVVYVGCIFQTELLCTGDITTCLSSDASLMSRSLAANVNILLRSLVMTIGIYCFMIQLCWPLALLSALESPITITAEKIYNKYYQVNGQWIH